MIESGLVYVYSPPPTRRFVGCGALVEGGYVATCRHVWKDAVKSQPGPEPEAEIEYPHAAWEDGAAPKRRATLVDACERTNGPPHDLVLLSPTEIPGDVMTLPVAVNDLFETGPGHAHAGRAEVNTRGEVASLRDLDITGEIAKGLSSDDRRQFTGNNSAGYWAKSGSSGSPVFVGNGQQLAGILSLSELGGEHEAFVVPGTVILGYLRRLQAREAAARRGIEPRLLQPVLAMIDASDATLAEIPSRIEQYVRQSRARAAEPAPISNDGADIDAVIAASRAKLDDLDAAAARELLQQKIGEEEAARRQRLLPLLRERAAVERIAFDHEAAKSTLGEITRLAPNDVWTWIDLGDLWRLTGPLDEAANAYRIAEAAARRTGDERGLSASHEKIGDVLAAQGKREAALKAYRAGLAISEGLARRDPANLEWQRDLSVSQIKIGDVLAAEGEREAALKAYRAGLAISEGLARRDSANLEWQRDLSVSQEKIGDVLAAEDECGDALAAYRAGLAIGESLARRDSANLEWQRDLIVLCLKISATEPAEAREMLTRALDIARRLEAEGRVGAWVPADLGRRFGEPAADLVRAVLRG